MPLFFSFCSLLLLVSSPSPSTLFSSLIHSIFFHLLPQPASHFSSLLLIILLPYPPSLTLSKTASSAEALIISAAGLFGAFTFPFTCYTLLQRLCRPSSPLHSSSPSFVSSPAFSPLFADGYAAFDSSLSPSPFWVYRVQLTVFVCESYVCVFRAVTVCQPSPFMLCCSFSSPPPPPPSSSFLFADRPVHCSTSLPLRQRSASLRIHAAAAACAHHYSRTIRRLFRSHSNSCRLTCAG